jgi:cation:H+ antiporter
MAPLILTLVYLLASAALIYFACEAFVNGVEWLGMKLGLTQTATGTLLAAFGTALPESVVTLVAVAFGNTPAQKDIGVGAALGGPLVLSTVAYGVTALVLLANARRLGRTSNPVVEVECARLRQDQLWFLAIFVVKVALGVIIVAWKPIAGFAFLAAYALYTLKELRNKECAPAELDDMEPLRIRPRDADPPIAWAVAQTLVALTVIFAASRFFVGQLESFSMQLGMSAELAALLLSPVATELPETMNAVIWVRQGKERLALANISGAMMIQATIPTAFGLFWTSWLLQPPLLVAAGVTMVAILYLQWIFRSPQVHARALAQVAWLYPVFAAIVAWRAFT